MVGSPGAGSNETQHSSPGRRFAERGAEEGERRTHSRQAGSLETGSRPGYLEKGIYYVELARVILKAEKSYDFPSASSDPGKPAG